MIWYLMVNLWHAFPAETNPRTLFALFSFLESGVEIGILGALFYNWLENRAKRTHK